LSYEAAKKAVFGVFSLNFEGCVQNSGTHWWPSVRYLRNQRKTPNSSIFLL
jgi:hypothetical protein